MILTFSIKVLDWYDGKPIFDMQSVLTIELKVFK